MTALLHNPWFWTTIGLAVFSAIASNMPAPGANSSIAYRWLFGALHTLSANIGTVLPLLKSQFPNPGDTMKKLTILLLFLLLPLSLHAQAATPSPTPDCSSATAESNCALHFITGSAMYQLENGKQATEFDARVPLTPRWSAFAAVFAVPDAKGNITVAGPEFREKLGHLLGKQSAKTVLNLNKIEVFGRAGFGSEANSVNGRRSFSYLAEGGAEFPLATIMGGPVVKTGVRIGYLGVMRYGAAPQHFVLGSNTAISPQVSISF